MQLTINNDTINNKECSAQIIYNKCRTIVRYTILLIVNCLIVNFLIFSTAQAQVLSTDLLNNPNLYNGKEVIYEGEVVGDIMGNWINVNDRNAAIGVWVKEKIALEEISYIGDYNTTGDTIRVTGVFNKACVAHGGDLDIHARHIEVIKLGNPIKRSLDRQKIYWLAFLFITAVLLYIFKTILHSRGKQT